MNQDMNESELFGCDVNYSFEEGANQEMGIGTALGLMGAGAVVMAAGVPVGNKLGNTVNKGIDKIGDVFKGE